MNRNGLHIMHVSLHGLIRHKNPEIGHDADTGGQVRYLLDLVDALDKDKRVRKVHLVTRKISDPRVAPEYAADIETISQKASIRRVAFGPRRYIRKEALWPYLSDCVDSTLAMIRADGDIPDALHAHYADAGFVAARLSKILGVPLIFTGHSLGRFKLQNLLARGRKRERVFEEFSFTQRFEAEEEAIENASLLIASSRNEVDEQYRLYDHYDPSRIMVTPPGCDIDRFGRPPNKASRSRLSDMLNRFLADPMKPALILLARPDPQKNIISALRIFAEPTLREHCNLVLFLGARDDIDDMDPVQRKLLYEVLYTIDLHDLYGRVAYPKHNPPDMAAALFHYARETGGLLLAPSRHENFGLTLVEAAAAGLPVATSGAGGMSDILDMCAHGIRIDPDDPKSAAAKIRSLLRDRGRWKAKSERGRAASEEKLSWKGHLDRYLPAVEAVVKRAALPRVRRSRPKPLGSATHMLVCDIDDTLTGNAQAIREFNRFLVGREDVVFGVATGRNLASAQDALAQWSITPPQFLITSVGTEIHENFGGLWEMSRWRQHISFRWQRERVAAVLAGLADLQPQEPEAQSAHKISYYCRGADAELASAIKTLLRQNLLQARVVVSKSYCVDVLPVRASKGNALRFLAGQWNVDYENIIAAGDSGNDLDMLRGLVKGIVVGNHSGELEYLRDDPGTFFSAKTSAAGVVDGLRHFGLAAGNTIGA